MWHYLRLHDFGELVLLLSAISLSRAATDAASGFSILPQNQSAQASAADGLTLLCLRQINHPA